MDHSLWLKNTDLNLLWKPAKAADTAPNPVPFCSIKHSSSDLKNLSNLWPISDIYEYTFLTYLSILSLLLFAKIPVYPLPDESLEFDLKVYQTH